MTISSYKRKRSFKKTPEPSGEEKITAKNKDSLIFVIHEHHATHLHWDLRLELGGVLKSWAVPKGPPMKPGDRRLAIHVEDHPYDYASFHGTIPEGNYGAGEVYIWDNGVYSSPKTADKKEAQNILREEYENGRIHLLMAGKRLKGLYTLVRTRDKQWLFMLKQDMGGEEPDPIPVRVKENKKESKTEATKDNREKVENKKRKDPMPHNIRPMLATLVDKPFDKDDWLFEFKWDGYRAIAEISNKGNNIELYSRKGNDFAKTYTPIVEVLRKIKHDCVLDGEIIALNEKGKIEFQLLQDYVMQPVPLKYAVFDLLYWDGEDLRERPLHERKTLLKTILPKSDALIYSTHIEKNGLKFFEAIEKEGGWEGMMAKQRDSEYISARSKAWLKIKSTKRQEAIIAGFTAPRGGRGYFGALILGLYKSGKLEYIGHTGTGFNETTLKNLHNRFSKIITNKTPFDKPPKTNMPVTWVRPELVCEVKFTEWTREGSLRHPVYMGLREDKPAIEVVKEEEQTAIKTKEQAISSISNQNQRGARAPQSTGRKNSSKNILHEKLRFTNLDKVYWPKEGYTKGDVIEYYSRMAEVILPYLIDRPESLLRNPDGINGNKFFQKNVGNLKLPDFVKTKEIESESRGHIKYLLCQNKETLLYLANLGCIELNPWSSRVGSLDHPDFMIIDLDPTGRTFDELIIVAQATKKVLDLACEFSFCKTSGKRGFHILVPIGAKYSYETIRIFSELLVKLTHERVPELTSLERSPSKRAKKIYLDHLQNRKGQTLAAPYCLRPWPGATVSTPLEWSEVKKGMDPSDFNINTIFKRLEKKGDLWANLFKKSIDLNDSIECLKKELGVDATKHLR